VDVQQPMADVPGRQAAGRLEALLHLARVSWTEPIETVFHAVAEVALAVFGFKVVAINVLRPEWDDYEVQFVHGDEECRDAILHTSDRRDTWLGKLLKPQFEVVPGIYFIPAGHSELYIDSATMFIPRMAATWHGPDAWQPEDELFVALKGSDGEVLGILSLDVPLTGRRPTAGDLELLIPVADHAALALETARQAAAAERHRRTLSGLLSVCSRLGSHTTLATLIEHVCASAASELGFETVAVYLPAAGGVLEVAACRGMTEAVPIEVDRLRHILAGDLVEGCALVSRADLFPNAGPSRLNGRGPRAWDDLRLVVPLIEADEDLKGTLVFDNPRDRLRPESELLQALRLLADHTVTALGSVERQTRLAYLAGHDPLTGIRNRLDLSAALDALASQPGGVSVLLCDLDHFKRVNDQFGHETGDEVLKRFGALLRSHARAGDLAVRFGGEEFCLVLPRVNEAGAMVAAERLRLATPKAMDDLVPGLTVSIGVATSGPEQGAASVLLAAADAALYQAKAAGRNQCRS
jgi:diguanylate cyclase (GGDEF)-like protein